MLERKLAGLVQFLRKASDLVKKRTAQTAALI